VCPALGYKEFLHADWLKQILSWQKPIGCWGTATNDGIRLADAERERDWPKLRAPVSSNNRSRKDARLGLEPLVFKTRQLLYEKVVSGKASIYLSFCLSLFVQKAQKHSVTITYSGRDSETTTVLNTALNT